MNEQEGGGNHQEIEQPEIDYSALVAEIGKLKDPEIIKKILDEKGIAYREFHYRGNPLISDLPHSTPRPTPNAEQGQTAVDHSWNPYRKDKKESVESWSSFYVAPDAVGETIYDEHDQQYVVVYNNLAGFRPPLVRSDAQFEQHLIAIPKSSPIL